MHSFRRCWILGLSWSLLIAFGGCSSVYYEAAEKLGFPKRDILVDRVVKAREAQAEAKEQFADALEKFLAVTRVDGGSLKSKYDQLNAELKRSETRATAVRERLDAVDSVSAALFSEWKRELRQYSDPALRRQSERQLADTEERYEESMRTMTAAAARMEPILGKFRDHVLFLKHNLNAQAIAGLSATARTLEADIARLIADMETSIREADAFIRAMKPTPQ
jgi:hypothetical protein